MVVGRPHLDHAVVAALLESAQQVSEVGGEVSRLSVGADHDAVLLVIAWVAKPQRAVALLDAPGLAQPLHRLLRQAGLPQTVLVGPLVAADDDPRDSRPDPPHQLVAGVPAYLPVRLL